MWEHTHTCVHVRRHTQTDMSTKVIQSMYPRVVNTKKRVFYRRQWYRLFLRPWYLFLCKSRHSVQEYSDPGFLWSASSVPYPHFEQLTHMSVPEVSHEVGCFLKNKTRKSVHLFPSFINSSPECKYKKRGCCKRLRSQVPRLKGSESYNDVFFSPKSRKTPQGLHVYKCRY